ncbi:hypothetical protein [Microbulbifer taiwanensis]|uniref:Uncharacterized protein n=1 Tax=Microbulbifer taiwanensis TaxID=986746 RepID=A0ABW1YPL6_9GAMM|nr:hypothetical protein [Microbulbifer taiwanensis]
MYIKAVDELNEHPEGEKILKRVNRKIYNQGEDGKFCAFLPSYILTAASYIDRMDKLSDAMEVGHALDRFSPYETRLFLRACAIDDEEDCGKDYRKEVNNQIRVANRNLSRLIEREMEKYEEEKGTFWGKMKQVFV